MAKKKSSKFPLWFHKSTGQWCKQVDGKREHFGTDKDEALARYKLFIANNDLSERQTVKSGCNHFLTAKEELVETDDLSPRTFNDYFSTSKRLVEILGGNTFVDQLLPEDFNSLRIKLSETRNPVSLGNEMTRVKTVFKWLYDNRFIDKPIQFGSDFKRPSRRIVRQHKYEQGKKLFSNEEIRLLMDEAGIHLKAMIYLGINAGFGNSDCANLPIDVVDLESGIIDWYRPKTGIDRKAILWPETIEALKASCRRRPTAVFERAEDKFFVNYEGDIWISDENSDNAISKWTNGILKRLKFNRSGMCFYWLRHTYRTIADQLKDQPAVMYTMGHVDSSMSGVYRQEILDDRLQAISDHVRNWLFAD